MGWLAMHRCHCQLNILSLFSSHWRGELLKMQVCCRRYVLPSCMKVTTESVSFYGLVGSWGVLLSLRQMPGPLLLFSLSLQETSTAGACFLQVTVCSHTHSFLIFRAGVIMPGCRVNDLIQAEYPSQCLTCKVD